MNKKLVVLSGPSGAGLGDIAAAVFAARKDVVPVVPVTARKMKEGEQDGVGFYFYDLDGWNALKESGDLLETTEFAGNDYGTSRRLVTELLDKGLNVMITDQGYIIKADQAKATHDSYYDLTDVDVTIDSDCTHFSGSFSTKVSRHEFSGNLFN